MRKLSILLVALLVWQMPTAAQVLDVGSVTANSSGSACTAVANSCAAFSLANGTIASVTLAVSGTFVGTLTFEGTSDNSTWFTLSGTKLSDGSSATTTTGTGQFSFNNSGLLGVRARATAWTSGTAVVTAARGYAVARWLTPFLSTISVGDGTASAPSIAFATETNSGWYRAGSGDLRASIAANDVVRLNSAGLSLSSTSSLFWGSSGVGSADTSLSRGAAGAVKFTATGTNVAMQLRGAQGTPPTCSSNCGTSPSVVGTDTWGTVTMGATGVPASGWVVTFNGTWAAAPSCTVTAALAGMAAGKSAIVVATTTTTMTVTTNGTAPAASDKYAYQCGGVQ